MKKLLLALFAVLFLLAIGLAVVPFFIPVDFVKARLSEAVKEKTGRDLVIAGDVKLTFWPSLAVKVHDVTFSNAGWAKAPQMLSIGELDLKVALQPLMQKRLDIQRFVLTRPVINLEVNAEGKGNWEFPKNTASAPEATASATESGSVSDITVGDVLIKDARLSYTDAATGKTQTVENFNLNVDYKGMQNPVTLGGDFVYKGEKVDFKTTLASPAVLTSAQGSDAQAELSSRLFSVVFKGKASPSAVTMASGVLDVKVPTLSGLLSWAGQQAELPIETLSVSGQAQVAKTAASFRGATLTADDMTFSGDFSADFSAKPSIKAVVKVPKLDLDRLMKSRAGDSATGGKKAPQAATGWSREKIDLSGMNAANADVTVETQGVVVQGIEIGGTTLKAVLNEGTLSVNAPPFSVFEGTSSFDLSINNQGALKLDIDAKDIAAKPVLTHFAGFKKLSGTMQADIKVNAQGQSVYDLISTLAGTSSLSFLKGEIQGVNLLAIAQNPIAGPLFGNPEASTPFSEISASFVIQKGIARNEDLSFISPVLEATGKGMVDLPAQNVNFRVVPRILARTQTTAEGQTVKKGLDVPLIISGPFTGVKVRPDLESLARDAIANPENLKDNVKDIGKNIEQNIKQFKKGEGGEDALKNLFQGLGGSGQ